MNIGRLAPGAADYYLGEVATSAEDYYSGKGESVGRWVGSLAIDLGLEGVVSPEAFRAVLDGRDPRTGEQLAVRPGRSIERRVNPRQGHLLGADMLDVPRVAARLGLSSRQVRRLLDAGARADRSATLTEGRVLIGVQVPREGRQRGLPRWAVPRGEVERFEARHGPRKARPGYDLTLRPPKSVSILWALGSTEQRAAIRDAHREAVDEVVAYIERHALLARVSKPASGTGRIETHGLVAAAFDHRTSRAGDPLLHSHVVTANLTRTVDGQWRAIDARGLFEHAHAAGFLYQAHLRHVLSTTLGLRFGPVRNGLADVEGVPRNVIEAFSKRRDEIEELVAEAGYTSARAHQLATLETRRAKDYGVDPAATERRWHAEAEALGFDTNAVATCFDHEPPTTSTNAEALFDYLDGPAGVTAQASTFRRHDVIEAIVGRLGAAPAGEVDRLADDFLASPRVVPLVAAAENQWELVWRQGGGRTRSAELARFTTPGLLRCEADLLQWADVGFGAIVPGAPPETVDAVLDRWPTLSVEQRDAVRGLCAPDGLVLQPMAGRPGAGKTFAMAAAIEAMTSAGIPVVGCSVAATAAAELEAATNLRATTGRPATTLARLFVELDRSALPDGAVVVVDEASMVGTRDLHRLAGHVGAAGGRVWLVGDPDQHGAVAAGGMFRRLVADHQEATPLLAENRRQSASEDRDAVAAYRDELIDTALARYDAQGRVHRAPTAAASLDAMVDNWFAAAMDGSRDPMIAGQHRVRRALNLRARTRLQATGQLGVDTLVTATGREFACGDWVIARRNAYQLRSDTGFVKNGSAGTVTAIDRERRMVRVAFDRDGEIDLPASYVDEWLEHGYARTTYGVQGQTLDRALYFAGDASSFEEGYVALTRGRHETHIYVVDGAVSVDDDDHHDGHEAATTGLATVTESMERRRSSSLALDADPLAFDTIVRYERWPLDALIAERQQLEGQLAGAPPSSRREIDSLSADRDAIIARSRAAALTGTDDAFGGALDQLDADLATLERRAAERTAWEAANADTIGSLRLVRRAESAARLQTDLAQGPQRALERAWRTVDAAASESGRSSGAPWQAQLSAVIAGLDSRAHDVPDDLGMESD